jgi:hypothetical protein
MNLNVVCIISENDLIVFYSLHVVENLAYKKHTWTNDQRLSRETKGDSSLAVDGFEESSKCATIDNCFFEKPIWMVDLGRRRNIAGVMLRTWHPNKDYLTNFDRYNVYIDHHFHSKPSNLCSYQSVTSSSRLHFQCQQPLNGRYVSIEAIGRNKFFTALLCEVFVYEQ